MPPTHHFDPATGVLTLGDSWSSGKFSKLVAQIGISNIKQYVIDDYARLSAESIDLNNVLVKRTGYFTYAHGTLECVENNGVLRARHATVTDSENDGMMFFTGLSRCRNLKNQRHLNLSQTFVYNLSCYAHSSVKATSSYIVDSTAVPQAALCLGPSLVLDGKGSFGYYSRPVLGSAPFSSFNLDMQLRFMVVELLCMANTIDSNYGGSNQRVNRLIVEICNYLNNNVDLSYDLAKEFASRIVIPASLRVGGRNRRINVVGARDRLAYCVGAHIL